jgi:hypothetical protein
MIVIDIWPSVRHMKRRARGKTRCQKSSTRYGSQRSPQGVSGYLHPPAPSTTLNKVTEQSGVQAKEKRGVGKTSDANLFPVHSHPGLLLPVPCHASHRRFMERSRYFKVWQRENRPACASQPRSCLGPPKPKEEKSSSSWSGSAHPLALWHLACQLSSSTRRSLWHDTPSVTPHDSRLIRSYHSTVFVLSLEHNSHNENKVWSFSYTRLVRTRKDQEHTKKQPIDRPTELPKAVYRRKRFSRYKRWTVAMHTIPRRSVVQNWSKGKRERAVESI